MDARHEIIGWTNAGAIPRDRLAEALRVAGVTPSAADWRTFAERLLAWLGAVLIASAAVYFIAANWQAIGRYAKFALVQAALIASIGIVWWRGVDSLAGRAALFAAAILMGVLLALVGQVYQTGADTYELFAAWALGILPWVLVGRQPALWLFWIALVDLAIVLYFRTSVLRGLGVFDLVFTTRAALWSVLAFDAAALAIWEVLAKMRGGWLAMRWAPRVLATAVGIAVTFLVVHDMMGSSRSATGWPLVAYAAFLGAMYWAYRVRRVDLFMLAGVVLSFVVVVSFAFARHVAWGVSAGSGSFLLIAIVVIACTAAGSYWLRHVGAEARAES